MRLLNTLTGELKEFNNDDLPRYAILSHVWQADELSFQSLRDLQASSPTADVLSRAQPKVRECCRIAREYGYAWVWVDTCCIDKSSSAELSEAINSMFAWYKRANACFAFLHDVDDSENPRKPVSSFRRSKWWTRAWTLQELLAPSMVLFFSRSWQLLGTKHSLAQAVHEITGIEIAILTGTRPIHTASVAQRMSWAARRVATRVEDRAYSVLGIFDVHMPTIYGEGSHAFIRLQEEILLRTDDQTIFCWGDFLDSHSSLTHSTAPPFFCRALQFSWPGTPPDSSPALPIPIRDLTFVPFSGLGPRTPLLAPSPECFAHAAPFEPLAHHVLARALGRECPPPEHRRLGTAMRLDAPFVEYAEVVDGWRRGFAGVVLRCQARGRLVVLFLGRRNEAPEHHYDLGVDVACGRGPFRELRGVLVPMEDVGGVMDRVDVRPIVVPLTATGTPVTRDIRLPWPWEERPLRARFLKTSVVISESILAHLRRTFGLRPRDTGPESATSSSNGLVLTLPSVEILRGDEFANASVCIVDAEGRDAFTITIGNWCACGRREYPHNLWVSVKAPSGRAHPRAGTCPCSGSWRLESVPRGSLEEWAQGSNHVVGGPVRGTRWAVNLVFSRLPDPNEDVYDGEAGVLCESRQWLLDIDVGHRGR